MSPSRNTALSTVFFLITTCTMVSGCGQLQQITGVKVPNALSNGHSAGETTAPSVSTGRSGGTGHQAKSGQVTPGSDFPGWVSTQARDIRFWKDDLSTQQGRLKDSGNCESFMGQVDQYDYVGTMRTIEARIAKEPGLMSQRGLAGDVERLRAMKPFFTDYADYVAREMTAVSDDVFAMQKDGDLIPAKNTAILGSRVCDAGLKLAADHAKLHEIRDGFSKVVTEIDVAIDKTYSGPFHKAHLNQIVFSSRPLVPGTEDAAAVKTSFTAADRIYGTVYLDQKLADSSGRLTLTFVEEGSDAAVFEWDLNKGPDGTGRMVFPLEIAPDPKSAVFAAMGADLATELASLAPRKRTMEVKLSFQQRGMSSGGTVAKGQIALDTTVGLETLAQTGEVLTQRVISETRMPKAGLKDAAVEKQMLAALTAAGWKETPLRAVITGTTWQLYYHAISGAVTSRDISAAVAVRTPKGECRYFNVTMFQNAMGRGFAPAQLGMTFLAHDMDCGNVAK